MENKYSFNKLFNVKFIVFVILHLILSLVKLHWCNITESAYIIYYFQYLQTFLRTNVTSRYFYTGLKKLNNSVIQFTQIIHHSNKHHLQQIVVSRWFAININMN